jgi:hypothetical protein
MIFDSQMWFKSTAVGNPIEHCTLHPELSLNDEHVWRGLKSIDMEGSSGCKWLKSQTGPTSTANSLPSNNARKTVEHISLVHLKFQAPVIWLATSSD